MSSTGMVLVALSIATGVAMASHQAPVELIQRLGPAAVGACSGIAHEGGEGNGWLAGAAVWSRSGDAVKVYGFKNCWLRWHVRVSSHVRKPRQPALGLEASSPSVKGQHGAPLPPHGDDDLPRHLPSAHTRPKAQTIGACPATMSQHGWLNNEHPNLGPSVRGTQNPVLISHSVLSSVQALPTQHGRPRYPQSYWQMFMSGLHTDSLHTPPDRPSQHGLPALPHGPHRDVLPVRMHTSRTPGKLTKTPTSSVAHSKRSPSSSPQHLPPRWPHTRTAQYAHFT